MMKKMMKRLQEWQVRDAAGLISGNHTRNSKTNFSYFSRDW